MLSDSWKASITERECDSINLNVMVRQAGNDRFNLGNSVVLDLDEEGSITRKRSAGHLQD
jgi:hypothetical protein